MSGFPEGWKVSFSLRSAQIINLQPIKPPTCPLPQTTASWKFTATAEIYSSVLPPQKQNILLPGDPFSCLLVILLHFFLHLPGLVVPFLSLKGCQQTFRIIHAYFCCNNQLIWSQGVPCNHDSCTEQKLFCLVSLFIFLNVRRNQRRFANTEEKLMMEQRSTHAGGKYRRRTCRWGGSCHCFVPLGAGVSPMGRSLQESLVSY